MAVFVIGIAGTAFAGYLSGVKFFSDTCALGESCPYFFGYPACYYGLLMYLSITAVAGLALSGRMIAAKARTSIIIVAAAGIMFAGYFTLRELPVWAEKGFLSYALGLPTCALGLIFYCAVMAVALASKKDVPSSPPVSPSSAREGSAR